MIKRYETDPIDRDERLGEAIEAYLALAEDGSPPDPETFAAQYPDLSDDLRAALDGLALVRGLVGDPSGPGHRLAAGHRVAGYRIVRELGRGGMGVVYEAVHVDLDRPVALKVLGTHAAPDSTSRRRFLNEARTAAGLHHTHIVPVFDVGQVGGLCYYAMQRIEGSGLDRVLRVLRRDRSSAAGSGASGTAPIPTPPSAAAPTAGHASLQDSTATWHASGPRALEGLASGGRGSFNDEPALFVPPKGSGYYRWVAEVGRRAAEALGHAHSRGIIHRDIKPSNLLVDARGSIWVADFGLARRIADPGLTQSDSRLGTPRYMSPEQADNGTVDARTDVYSLGATLYELLTLKPPFDGRNAAELTRQICLKDPSSPRQLDRKIPKDLETIVLKAMAKRPADRYATAVELAEDLNRFLGYEPVLARRIGPLGRMWRVAQRHPGITAVSTAAAITVLGVATFAYVHIMYERDLAIQARKDAQAALYETEAANRAQQAAMLDSLLNQAKAVRLSTIPNRREPGLQLLDRAATLHPKPTERTKLRDEAAEFFALRDIEPHLPGLPTGKVHGLAFGPEGMRLATLSDDGSQFAVWDIAKRQRIEVHSLRSATADPDGQGGPPAGMRGPMSAARIAAAGSLIAALWHNGRGIYLYDVATGDSFNWPMPGREISSLLAAPDGQRLVTVERVRRSGGSSPRSEGDGRPGRAPDDYRVNLWNPEHHDAPIATLVEPRSGQEGPTRRPLVAVSPDGEIIASGRPAETLVTLWTKDGQPRGEIETRGALSALALGPDGLLATAGGGMIQIWPIDARTSSGDPTAQPLAVLNTRISFMSLVRFSPDGTMLAVVGGPSQGIELWDLATDTQLATLPISDGVTDLAFSPNGRLLAAGGRSDTVSAWTIVDPIALVRMPEFRTVPRSLAFGPGGLLAMASGELRLWGLGRCPAARRQLEKVKPWAVTFDDQGCLLAADPVAIYRFPKAEHQSAGKIDASVEPEQFDLPELFAPPGRAQRKNSPPRANPPAGPNPFGVSMPIARSSDGRSVVLARFGELLLWHPDDPHAITRITLSGWPDFGGGEPGRGRGGFPSWRDIALSPAADRMYLLRREDEFSAWSLSGDRAEPLTWKLRLRATSMALSPDGAVLALGDRTGRVTLVDTRDGSVQNHLSPLEGEPEERVWSLAFSPNGKELAVGTRDQVRLWSLAPAGRPEPLVRLPGHRGSIVALAYDSEGLRLATSGDDKIVEVWDLGRMRQELKNLGLDW